MLSPALALILALPLPEKLARLARVAPEDMLAIEMAIDYCLKRSWPQFTLVDGPPKREAQG